MISFKSAPDVQLAGHDAGQESNQFWDHSSVTNAPLYAFQLTNNTASTRTVTQVQFQLSAVSGIAQGDFANLKIYVDSNNNGTVDAGETTTVGGSGVVNSGVTTITFSTSFTIAASTSVNYILTGNVSNLASGDTVTIGLGSGNVTVTGETVTGSTTSVTHTECGSGTFSYRRQITVDHTKVSSSCGSDPSDFPILISISGDVNLKTVANGGHVQNSSGYDIVFRNSTGLDQLYHEVEKYDGSAGTLVAWVKIPTLSRTSDTTIYMYYGNPCVSAATESPTNVWDSNYVGVWHLKESGNGTANEFKDSTTVNNGQGGGGTAAYVPTLSTSGKIDGAQSFDGTNDYISVPNNSSLNVTSGLTMEAWVYLSNSSNNQKIVGKTADPAGYGYLLGVQTCHLYPEIWNSQDTDYTFTSGTISSSTWTHLAVTWKTSGSMIGYINGSQVNSISAGNYNIGTSTNVLRIGATPWNNPPTQFFTAGTIDEVRISNTARTQCWN